MGLRLPLRDNNGGATWSVPHTHILDLTNSAQWVTGTHRTVESGTGGFPLLINRVVLVPFSVGF